MPDYVIRRIKWNYRDLPIIVDPEVTETLAPTCLAHYSKDLSTRLVKDLKTKYGLRTFSSREYARLQGFPDDFYFENKSNFYKLIGKRGARAHGQMGWCYCNENVIFQLGRKI